MADVHSKEIRSYNMSRVRSKNTKPEVLVRRYLFANGFRFRLHIQTLPGKPDIVLPKYKTVVLINGCFWHNHSCKSGELPKDNFEFWNKKIGKNVERDKINVESLEQNGWMVIIIWECELKKTTREKKLKIVIDEIRKYRL